MGFRLVCGVLLGLGGRFDECVVRGHSSTKTYVPEWQFRVTEVATSV